MTTIRSIGAYEGASVEEAVLDSGAARIAILNYGCVIRDWRVPAPGREVPCVLGFERFEPYPEHSRSFGIVAASWGCGCGCRRGGEHCGCTRARGFAFGGPQRHSGST